ncbi:MAG: BON domain-containing protein [Desulfobacterales bacterium]|nr:BON domain-containing protein [Desulfobacterales bacterium]
MSKFAGHPSLFGSTATKLLKQFPVLREDPPTALTAALIWYIIPWKKFHAENIAAREPGVIDIRNDLTVVPTKTIADREIADNILASLKRKSVVNEQDVDVRVENGVVNLTGTVPSPIAGRAVKETARYTPGVMQVVDNMTVGVPG